MSLTTQERNAVLVQIQGRSCTKCGGKLSPHDDGVSTVTQWGVSGAYVSCDDCGEVHNKADVDTDAFIERLELLLRDINFGDYTFQVGREGDRLHLKAVYDEPDIYTDKLETQTTRKWLLSPYMTDSEIVQTAFKLCLTSMEHRTRELFKYKGARIFGPHFDVDDLVTLCKDGREDAGGRKDNRIKEAAL